VGEGGRARGKGREDTPKGWLTPHVQNPEKYPGTVLEDCQLRTLDPPLSLYSIRPIIAKRFLLFWMCDLDALFYYRTL